jgi:hypothetical protein
MKFATDLSKGVLGGPDPENLWVKIIDHIPDSALLKPGVRILSVACGHCTEAVVIARRMLSLGISKEQVRESIWLLDKYYVFTNHAKLAYGFTNVITADFLEWNPNMRFDVIVGNPPFSAPKQGKIAGKRASELYTLFFEKSLRMADIVAMVLPTTDKKVQEKHNTLLRNNTNTINYINPEMFPGIAMPMWYVVCNKGDLNRPDDINWALKDIGNTIPWTKGSVNMTMFKNLTGGHGTIAPINPNDVIIYHKVNATRGLVVRYGDVKYFTKSQLFPTTGYAVLMPQTFSDSGWSKIEIVQCNGNQAAFNGINIVFTATLEQANSLIEIMKTPEFIAQGNQVKQGFNNMNLSCLKSIKINYTL